MSFYVYQILTKNNLSKLLIKNDIRYLSSSMCLKTNRSRTNQSHNKTKPNKFKNLTNSQKSQLNQTGRQVYYQDEQFKSQTNQDSNQQTLNRRSFANKLIDQFKISLKIILGKRLDDAYYFKLDQMNNKDFELVYLDVEWKVIKFFSWFIAIACPFAIFSLIKIYFKKQEQEFIIREDEGDFELYQLIFLSTGFILYFLSIFKFLTRITSRIYFNRETKKFNLILNRIPFIPVVRKLEIDCGQVCYKPSKIKLFRLFIPDYKLPNNERIHIKDHLFLRPFYSNLLFGFTKHKKMNYKIY